MQRRRPRIAILERDERLRLLRSRGLTKRLAHNERSCPRNTDKGPGATGALALLCHELTWPSGDAAP